MYTAQQDWQRRGESQKVEGKVIAFGGSIEGSGRWVASSAATEETEGPETHTHAVVDTETASKLA